MMKWGVWFESAKYGDENGFDWLPRGHFCLFFDILGGWPGWISEERWWRKEGRGKERQAVAWHGGTVARWHGTQPRVFTLSSFLCHPAHSAQVGLALRAGGRSQRKEDRGKESGHIDRLSCPLLCPLSSVPYPPALRARRPLRRTSAKSCRRRRSR